MTDSRLELTTRCAHWGRDNHRYFGQGVFDELAGDISLVGLTALSVLGRRLSREQCDVLDEIVAVATMADPRIWPLKITRVVAAYGSVMPAVAAGLANLQGAVVSPWITSQAAITLQTLSASVAGLHRDECRVKAALEALFAKHGAVTGFGIPCRDVDERLVALASRMRFRQRDELPYFCLLNTIRRVAPAVRRCPPNIGLGFAAAILDLGISNSEVGPLTTALFPHMFFANALEGARQAPSVLRELPDEVVTYIGVERRTSPRSQMRNSVLRPKAKTAEIPLERAKPSRSG